MFDVTRSLIERAFGIFTCHRVVFGQQERLTNPRHQRLDRFRFHANRNAWKGFAKAAPVRCGLAVITALPPTARILVSFDGNMHLPRRVLHQIPDGNPPSSAVRVKRHTIAAEKLHVAQSTLLRHFFQPRFAAALPDNGKNKRFIAQAIGSFNNVFQPLLFTNIAGVKNDFFVIRQAKLVTKGINIGVCDMPENGRFPTSLKKMTLSAATPFSMIHHRTRNRGDVIDVMQSATFERRRQLCHFAAFAFPARPSPSMASTS